jgi:ribosome biogenesis GTPase
VVVKAQSGFFTVATKGGHVVAQIPGRLKRGEKSTTLVAVGDYVTISLNEDGSGTIESVAERKSALSRSRTSAGIRKISSDQEQVLLANPDQVIFVFATRDPFPSLRKLDRFLVVAEMNQLPAVICVNKVDLTDMEAVRQQFSLYEQIGYRIIYTSAKSGVGVDELKACLQGKISVLTGSSGVGKSTLLNAIQPGLGLQARDVSRATGKGLHTTRYAEMFPLDGGGYVADTPGIRGLAIFDVEPGELDAYFREIAPLVANCQFSDCSHQHEPNCAVKAAVVDGRVSQVRYESYLRLREEHESLDRAEY